MSDLSKYILIAIITLGGLITYFITPGVINGINNHKASFSKPLTNSASFTTDELTALKAHGLDVVIQKYNDGLLSDDKVNNIKKELESYISLHHALDSLTNEMKALHPEMGIEFTSPLSKTPKD